MDYWKILLVIYGIIAGTLTWEHIARKNNSNVKPSVGINYIFEKSRSIFTKLGESLAVISSFYTYINCDEISKTAIDLGEPLINTIVSPIYIVRGYIGKTKEYSYPFLTGCGTLTLVLLIYYLYGKYDIELIRNTLLNYAKKFNKN